MGACKLACIFHEKFAVLLLKIGFLNSRIINFLEWFSTNICFANSKSLNKPRNNDQKKISLNLRQRYIDIKILYMRKFFPSTIGGSAISTTMKK